jgi:WD40 repeat protein
VWNYDAQLVEEYHTHNLGIVSLDLVKSEQDENYLATAAIDGTIQVNKLESKEKILVARTGSLKQWTISHHPKERLIVTGKHSGGVCLIAYKDQQDLVMNSIDEEVQAHGRQFTMSVKFNPAGSQFATGGMDGSVKIYDTNSGTVQSASTNSSRHYKSVRALAFMPSDPSILLAGSEDQNISMFDLRTGLSNRISTLSVHQGWVLSLSASQSSMIVSSSSDGSIKLHDARKLSSSHLLHSLDGAHSNRQVWSVAFSPNSSNQIVSGGDDGNVLLISF